MENDSGSASIEAGVKFIFVSANVRIPARVTLLLASTKKSFLEGLASISQVSWKDRENLGRTVAAALCISRVKCTAARQLGREISQKTRQDKTRQDKTRL